MAKIFSENLLDYPIEAERLPLKKYDLNRLLQPMDFPVDTEDGIESVKITLIKFKPKDEQNRIQFELCRDETKTIHEKVREWHSEHHQLRSGSTVMQAKIVIRFTKGRNGYRNKVLPIKLSSPNGSDLKNRTEQELLIGEKYLKRWGLMVEVD